MTRTRIGLALLAFAMIVTMCAPIAGLADMATDPYEAPVKITWGVQASQVQQFFDGDTYDNNRWSKLIKNKLNIDLEVAFSADITTDAYRDKLNALL
ncbi:MAG: hypothetical protein LBB86_06515, partial [Oscillospiraceae bacterium]|nr:hypothetical protein [Oscillospiraceae bacterium]